MKLLGQRILIEPVNARKMFAGLFLPDCAEQDNAEGIVRAIGSEIREALPYTRGSHVFIAMYAGMKVTVMNNDWLVVEKDDVCGVLVGDRFHPIGNKILLKPMTEAVDDKIHILLPDVSMDRSQYKNEALTRFSVHLIGNGVRSRKGAWRPFSVKVGDTVLAKPFAGRDVDALEGCYKLVTQDDIEAVLTAN